jgi:hypothetical protein
VTAGPTQTLIDECQRQSENCSYTATTFTIWLRWLRRVRTFCVVAPIVFGALATWKLLADVPSWSAVFMLLTTAIPPAYRASKKDAEIEEYTTLTGEFTNLRDRFRQAALITSRKPFAEFDAEVKVLMDRLEKARRRALTPPEWCFRLARLKHKAGHYHHDYDEARASKPTPASY